MAKLAPYVTEDIYFAFCPPEALGKLFLTRTSNLSEQLEEAVLVTSEFLPNFVPPRYKPLRVLVRREIRTELTLL
jgi:hypothetical protein